MGNKVIICGGNGAGKSTIGRKLAQELGWKFMDIEDYYFPSNKGNYNYEKAHTREEVAELLLEDMKKYDDFILASVKGDYGAEVASMLTGAVLISVPKEIRMKRVRDRSYQKFGNRMLQGGDLFEKENRFFDMVEKRSEKDVTQWLEAACIPVIQVDGTQSTENSVQAIICLLAERYGCASGAAGEVLKGF